jgi:chromosome segregation ATPase
MRKTICVLFLAANAIAQAPPKDGDTVQALLVEVRQLRQDIEAMTVASQRVQIALYALQMQDGAVSRSRQRLDEARGKRMQAEAVRDHMATEVRMSETRSEQRSGMETPTDLKVKELAITQLKGELERSTTELQSWQAVEAEAASQLRTDQVKLNELQERIERLDQVLSKMGLPGK